MSGRIAEGNSQTAVRAAQAFDAAAFDRVASAGAAAAVTVPQATNTAPDVRLTQRSRRRGRTVLVQVAGAAQAVVARAAAVAAVAAAAIVAGDQAAVGSEVAQPQTLALAARRSGAFHAAMKVGLADRARGRALGAVQALDARVRRQVTAQAWQAARAVGRALPVPLIEAQLSPACGTHEQQRHQQPTAVQRPPVASASASARAKPWGKRAR